MALDNCEAGSGDAAVRAEVQIKRHCKVEFFANGKVIEKEVFESHVEKKYSLKIK